MASSPRTSAVRRREVTRERMLDAAARVLATEGIQGASVEHICEQAGFTRGAFYSNFSSKDELLMALFEREKQAMVDRMQQAADPTGLEGLDLHAVIGVMMDRFMVLQPLDRNWYLRHVEFELRGIRHDEVGRAFNAATHEIRLQVEAMIEAVLDRFGYRMSISRAHVATILMGAYEHALRDALVENRDMDLGLLRETLPTLLLAVTEPV